MQSTITAKRRQRLVLGGILLLVEASLLYLHYLVASLSETDDIRNLPPDETPTWNPHYYAQNLNHSLARGLNFINTHSGCHVACWVATGEERRIQGGNRRHFLEDCIHPSPEFKITEEDRRLKYPDEMNRLQPYDTVYVTFVQLKYFVDNLLPRVEVPFVIITGQWDINGVPVTTEELATAIVDNPFVLHWFCHNIDIYAGGRALHPKVSPWPYGLQGKPVYRGSDPIPMNVFRRIFLKYLGHEKKQRIFVSRLKNTTAKRNGIPNANIKRHLPLQTYLEFMALSEYVISPNGDRPECYRTYEAIGLGTIPLTQLDPLIHTHLALAPVIFNNTDWNLARLEKDLPAHGRGAATNQCLIFEEYWMEYAERKVGQPLRWWDVHQEGQVRLEEFVRDKTALMT